MGALGRVLKVMITGDADGLADAFGDGEKAAGGFGEKLRSVAGMAAGLAGVGLAAGSLGAAFSAGLDLSAAQSKLQAQMNLTKDQAARIGKIAGRVYADGWGESSTEAMQSIRSIGAAFGDVRKMSDAELQKLTEGAYGIADTFDAEIGDITKAAGNLVKNGLAKDGKAALDLLASGMSSTANKAGDLLETADEYAGALGKIGLTGEAAFGKMQAFIDAGGWSSDLAADSLREWSIRTTDGSLATSKALAKVGIDWKKLNSDVAAGGDSAAKALDGTIDMLKAVKDPVLQNQAGAALFGSMWEDGGSKAILAMGSTAKSMNVASDAAKKMGDTLSDNARAKWESFKRTAVMGVQNAINSHLLPAVMKVVDVALPKLQAMAAKVGPVIQRIFREVILPAVASLGRWWSQNGPTILEWVRRIATVVGVLAVVALRAARFILDNWSKIAPVVKPLAYVIMPLLILHWTRLGIVSAIASAKQLGAWTKTTAVAVGSSIKQVGALAATGAKWIWAGVVAMASGIRMAAAWVIGLGPIGWVIAAVVGLVALFVWKFDAISKIVSKCWTWVKEKTSAVWRAIVGFVKKHAVLVALAVTGPIGALVVWVVKNWSKIKEKTSQVWSSIVGFVKRHAVLVALAVTGPIGALVVWVVKNWDKIKHATGQAISKTVDFFRSLPSRIWAVLSSLPSRMAHIGVNMIRGLISGIRNAAGELVEAVKRYIIDKLPGPVRKALDIHSPSRVFRAIGRFVSKGLALGIQDDSDTVREAALALTNFTVTAPRTGVAAVSAAARSTSGSAGTTGGSGGSVNLTQHFHNHYPDPRRAGEEAVWALKTAGR